jgi:hypothetical protein
MSGLEPMALAALFGSAGATGAGMTTVLGSAAATSGLLGAGGAFAAGTALSTTGTLLGLAGAGMSAMSSIQQGKNAQSAAEANQRNLNAQAIQDGAVGQRSAINERRKAGLMLSRAQAVAAASGGGPLDENLMTGILEEGERAAGFQQYTATERAKGLQYQGDIGRYEADNTMAAAKTQAIGTLLGAAGKAGSSASKSGLFDRFAPASPSDSLGLSLSGYRRR